MDQETPDPTPTSSGKTGQVNYKNSLQQHAQRSAVSLPVYWTVNQGPPHAPRFKSSVTVDGETFSSTNVFTNRKEAEQDVSRIALKGIAENLKTKGVPLLRNEVEPMQLCILYGCLSSRLGCLIKSVLGKTLRSVPMAMEKDTLLVLRNWFFKIIVNLLELITCSPEYGGYTCSFRMSH